MQRVAIILVNWNSRLDTLECLESVFRLDYPEYRVVVCDNASRDGTLEAVEQWAASGETEVAPASPYFKGLLTAVPRPAPIECIRLDRHAAESVAAPGSGPALTLIDTGGNLGFAGGNNVGIRYALRCLQADYLWLLNTDTVVDPGALGALVARAQRDVSLGLVGSSLVYYWAPDTVQAMGGARLERRTTRIEHVGADVPVTSIPRDTRAVERDLAYVVGASMLVTRAFVQQVGLMNESYFLYYEEIDWACRASGRFGLGYAADSLVYHKVGGASRRVASVASLRYMWRNRIKFVARHLPESLPGTLLAMALDMLRFAAKGRFAAARAIGGALLDRRQLSEEGLRMDIGAVPP